MRWLVRVALPSLSLVGTCVFPLSPVAAQPDINDAPKAANPPNQERRGRGGFARGGMTIEQLLQSARARRETTVRQMLTRAGFADAAIQDPVLAHLEARQAMRPKAREAILKMLQAMDLMPAGMQGRQRGADGAPQEALTPTETTELLAHYRAAIEADRAAREEAERDLDSKIKFSQNPRLAMAHRLA